MSSWEVFESIFSDRIYETSGEVHSLACNEDYICAGLRQGIIQVFDLNTDESFELKSHTLAVNSLYLSDTKLISGAQDSIVTVWDLSSRSQQANLPAHDGVITSVAVHDACLYTCSIDQKLKQWDINSVKMLNEAVFSSAVCCIKIKKDLYVGTEEGDIEVLSYNLEKLYHMTGHLDAVWCIDLFNDVMVSSSYDGTIRLWDTASKNSEVIGEHNGVVNKVGILDPSGAGIPMIISVGSDAVVKFWALDGLKDTMEYHASAITSLDFLDMFFVTAGFDSKIRMWSLMNHLKIKKTKIPEHTKDFEIINNQFALLHKGDLTLNNKKIETKDEPQSIFYDVFSKNLIILAGFSVYFYSITDEVIVNQIEIEERGNCVSAFNGNIAICSESNTFSWFNERELKKVEIGGHYIDICSQYIILISDKITVHDTNFVLISEHNHKFESAVHSRNEKYVYCSTPEGISLFSLPSLQLILAINFYKPISRLKLHPKNGIHGLASHQLLLIPEYDIEKQIILD
jgi:WD40 repeat protein